MQLRELLTKWNFEVKDEPLKRVEAHLGQIKRGMDFLIGSHVVKQLVAFEDHFSKWAHELYSVSIASGVAATTIQQLAFAGSQFGASQEEITGAMAGLSLKINEARMGIEGAQRAFAMAGFSGQQLNSWKNGNDALMALADRMKATVDPIRKQAIAAELGVSANSKLYAMLSQGSGVLKEMAKEANELGIVLSDRQVKGLVDAQNALSKFSMIIQGIGKQIASLFAPSVKSAVDSILEFYKANKKVIEINIKEFVYDFTYALGYLWGIIKFVAKAVLDFAAAHPVLFRRILEVVAVVGSLVVGLTALGVLIAPMMIAFTSLSSLFGVCVTVFELLGAAAGFLTGALGLLFSPIVLWVAGISLLIMTLKSLWDMFVNGMSFKDTALGKALLGAWDMLGTIKDGLISVNTFFANLGEGIISVFAKIGDMMAKMGLSGLKKYAAFLGFGGEEEKSDQASKTINNLNSVSAATSVPQSMQSSSVENNKNDFSKTNNSTSTSVDQRKSFGESSINSPITIQINSNQNPMEIAKQVKYHIEDHYESMTRKTHQTLKSQVVH